MWALLPFFITGQFVIEGPGTLSYAFKGNSGIDTRLKELLLEYAANISVDIMEMEIMPDHVHMLMEVNPQFGIHKAVKSLKGYTSKILRSEYPSLKTRMPSLWTNSYFVSTVGGAPIDVIKQYIENQKTSQRQKDKLG